MNRSYKPLFESIRTKCQQECWFGPELLSPLHRMHVRADDPNRFGFVFPPASEEQLCITELRLGFCLPPLLRALYANIANGGFGPGLGLRGALEGYGRPGASIYRNSDDTIVAQYLWRSHRGTFDLAEYVGQCSNQETYGDMEVPYGLWLRHLLPICDMGCVQEICVDSQERLFLVAPLDSNEVYGLSQMSWTFEEWLWRWVRDEELLEGYEGAA